MFNVSEICCYFAFVFKDLLLAVANVKNFDNCNVILIIDEN